MPLLRLLAPLALLSLAAAAGCSRRHGERPAPPPAPAPNAPVGAVDSAPAVGPAPGTLAEPDAGHLRDRRLMVPVEGVRPSDVRSTFFAARGTTRTHNALDIMAARGTPVLSADDGRVYRLRSNRAGGLTVYAVDTEERFVYYYAHLDRYRDGLTEGAALAKGDVLGYVGTTGNAPPNVPHLHFQVMRMGADRHWWDGTPVDPTPYLVLDGKKR